MNRSLRTLALTTAAFAALVGCSADDDATDDDHDDTTDEAIVLVDADATDTAGEPTEGEATTRRATLSPAAIEPGMTWHWQLQGDIDTTIDADVFDIDLFDTPATTIHDLHDRGRVVICYFSTAWEDWRADAASWPTDALGGPLDDWEGERWVDIRDDGVRDVLAQRLDLAVEKGCDAVEPDNITAYRNDSGFDLSLDDQLDFNRTLAAEAANRGLLIGLKNGLEQIPALVDEFDFAVNEQCVQYDECGVYEPFVLAGKAVFGAEYSDEAVADPERACDIAAASGVTTLILPVELDGSFRTTCR